MIAFIFPLVACLYAHARCPTLYPCDSFAFDPGLRDDRARGLDLVFHLLKKSLRRTCRGRDAFGTQLLLHIPVLHDAHNFLVDALDCQAWPAANAQTVCLRRRPLRMPGVEAIAVCIKRP